MAVARINRLPELEGLRGVLAWWVVLGHLYLIFADWPRGLHSRDAVLVFMCLSGFVIWLRIDVRQEAYLPFLTRRFFRLWPAYTAILVIAAISLPLQRIGLESNVFSPERNVQRLAWFDQTEAYFSAHMMAHIPMLHGLVPTSWLPGTATALVGQGWSVSLEWQYYILAPAAFLLVRGGIAGWIALVAVSLALYAASIPMSNYAFIGEHLAWFAFGIASYTLWRHREARAAQIATVVLCAFAFAIAPKIATLVWSAATIMIVFPDFAPSSMLCRCLRVRLLQAAGRCSYSTYVVHMLVIYFSMLALSPLHLHPALYAPVLVVMVIASTALASEGMYRLAEKPGMALGEQIASRIERQGPTFKEQLQSQRP